MQGSHIDAVLWSSDCKRRCNVRMRLDPNDAYTRLPEKMLCEMGWTVKGRLAKSWQPSVAALPDPPESLAIGRVGIEIEGALLGTLAVFEPDDCEPVLGAHALHCLGVKVAPEHRIMVAEMLYPSPRTVACDDPG